MDFNFQLMEQAIFCCGCFCTEAVFKRLKGVLSVRSGYTGGFIKNLLIVKFVNGDRSCRSILIEDAQQVSYQELLEVFFATHNPTTLNRQGYDVGSQYRSAFLHQYQQETAQHYMNLLHLQQFFPILL